MNIANPTSNADDCPHDCDDQNPDALRGYLTFVPRGLEHVASCVIEESLTSQSYACEHLKVLVPKEETGEYINGLSNKLRKQKLKKRLKDERRKKWMDASANNSKSCDNNDSDDDHDTSPVVGTLRTQEGEQISLGHYKGSAVFSKPGPIEGVLPLQFYTNAPPIAVAGIRGMGCGPLLALVTSSHHIKDYSSSAVFEYDQSVDQAKAAAEAFVGKESNAKYLSQFRDALSLLFDHAEHVWFANRGEFYGINMEDSNNKARCEVLDAKRRGDAPLSFRVSCTRTYSKRYKHWKRDDIMTSLANLIVPSDDLKLGDDPWKVDLKKHDFEVLAIIHETALTVGIVLRPYQLLKVKTYSSGRLAPDITPPYITGLGSSEDIIRLRPSTASLLLHLAQVKKGEIVLDPCSGIGTIPVEASLSGTVGVGGDRALKTEDFARLATKYLASSEELSSRKGTAGAANFATWDATLLPIREEVVDCIISDLPFGSKCLSAKKLSRFLPLLMSECARVLRPTTGRCVLLCGPGSCQSVVDAICMQKTTSGSNAFECTSIFPANIGGLVAWIVIVRRGEGSFIRSSNHRDGVRTLASMSRQQKKSSQKAKRRRVQS